jgi:hypothetical protein
LSVKIADRITMIGYDDKMIEPSIHA